MFSALLLPGLQDAGLFSCAGPAPSPDTTKVSARMVGTNNHRKSPQLIYSYSSSELIKRFCIQGNPGMNL